MNKITNKQTDEDKKLIEKIQSFLDVDGDVYREQLRLSQIDFRDYCEPGAVNNWQHPQKPPTQASMALVANAINAQKILDFGTGLTAYTLLKHTNADVISIDNSFVWLKRLHAWLENKNLDTSGLTYFESVNQGMIYNFEKDINAGALHMASFRFMFQKHLQMSSLRDNRHSLEIKKQFDKDPGLADDILGVDSNVYLEPSFIQMIASWKHIFTEESWAAGDWSHKSNQCTTDRFMGYIANNSLIPIEAPNASPKRITELGKFSFIQFDFGHMWSRIAYLQCAVSMLDRTKPSVILIDDLHKKEIFYNNKSFMDIATEVISGAGGEWLHCEKSTTDFQGGYADFAYFPATDFTNRSGTSEEK